MRVKSTENNPTIRQTTKHPTTKTTNRENVVYGHIHKASVERFQEVNFCNTGSCDRKKDVGKLSDVGGISGIILIMVIL